MLDFEQSLIDEWPDDTRYLITRQRDDHELGIFPAIAAAIPMVANLAGSLLGKKDKSGAPSAEASSAQNVLDVLTKAIGGDPNEGSIKEVVRNIVATVPSPVLKQVQDGIRQLRNSEKASANARDLIVQKVDTKFGPQIHALLAAVKAGQLQRAATNEHNILKARNTFRSSTTKSLADISKRLAFIEQRLAASAVVQGADRIRILGGRRMLEK